MEPVTEVLVPVDVREHDAARPVLELDAVSKIYPSEPPVVALREVSFSVTAGELVAIVGPSGSGKSTLLHLIGTLDRPSTGTVRITGSTSPSCPDRELSGLRATRIGFVFQQFFLAEHQSVLDNVAERPPLCRRRSGRASCPSL